MEECDGAWRISHFLRNAALEHVCRPLATCNRHALCRHLGAYPIVNSSIICLFIVYSQFCRFGLIILTRGLSVSACIGTLKPESSAVCKGIIGILYIVTFFWPYFRTRLNLPSCRLSSDSIAGLQIAQASPIGERRCCLVSQYQRSVTSSLCRGYWNLEIPG